LSPWPATASGAGALKSGETIYFIPKDTLNPYEVIADAGGKTALTAIGDKEVISSGTVDTAAAQIPSIQAAIAAKAAAIVIAGNDPRRCARPWRRPRRQASRWSRSTPT
jgi:rhamnose transport system substrate-binding protein